MDGRYEELHGRGVEFAGPPAEEPFGRAVELRDPDGHILWLRQLPDEDDPRCARVEPHAPLREADGEARGSMTEHSVTVWSDYI